MWAGLGFFTVLISISLGVGVFTDASAQPGDDLLQVGTIGLLVGFTGVVHIRVATFMSLIEDLCASYASIGFKRIVFLNGHYDNTYAIAYACATAAERMVAAIGEPELVDTSQDQRLGRPGTVGLLGQKRVGLLDRLVGVALGHTDQIRHLDHLRSSGDLKDDRCALGHHFLGGRVGRNHGIGLGLFVVDALDLGFEAGVGQTLLGQPVLDLGHHRLKDLPGPEHIFQLIVDGLPDKQPDVSEEKKGPRVGAPEQAVQGFLKAAGLTSLDQAQKREAGHVFNSDRSVCMVGQDDRTKARGPVHQEVATPWQS